MIRSSMLFTAVFAHFNHEINIIEKPSNNALTSTEFEKSLVREKNGLEYYLKKKLECNNPVMGFRSGHNIPLPEEQVLKLTIERIDQMISSVAYKKMLK